MLCCYGIQASQDSCKLQVTAHGEPGLGCIYEAALEFYGILRSVTVMGGPRSWTAQVEVGEDSASASLQWVSLLPPGNPAVLGLPSPALAESTYQARLGRGEEGTVQVTATSA